MLRLCLVLLPPLGAATAVALAVSPRGPAPEPPAVHGPDDPARPYSNIYPEDYVGPEKCGECHESNYRFWRTHPHSRMNRNATGQTVKGDFSGVDVRYGGGARRIRFERGAEGAFLMTLYDGEMLIRQHRVTRVVGSRYNQFYIGVQTLGPEPEQDPCYREERKLPFAYWFAPRRWLPEIYFDSFPPAENDYDEAGSFADWMFHRPSDHPWEISCISCHNTYPYVQRFRGRGEAWSKGFPDQSFVLSTRGGAAPWIDQFMAEPTIEADTLVTLGISCESCHFGGRSHAVDAHPIRWRPTSPDLELRVPNAGKHASDRQNPWIINSICRQCHSAEVDRYANGAGAWNSAEALDQDLGACASQIKCTDCHNPHRPGPVGGSPDQPRHIRACLKCHEEYRSPAARAAHSNHPPGAKVSCLDCHMPRMVQGIETVVRSHRISSPGDPSMLASGAFNACNLCHLEEPVTWTLGHLERGWGVKVDPAPEWAHRYGEGLARPVGETWLRSSDQTVRLIAAMTWAASGQGRGALPRILDNLVDRYAVNRVYGQFAIEKILGRPLTREEYDLLAPEATRREQVERLRETLARTTAAQAE